MNQKEQKIKYFDLYGLRKEKYDFLEAHDVKNIKWQELEPKGPNCFFVPKDMRGEEIYEKFISLKDIFEKCNAGIATGKDDVLVNFDKQSLIRKLSMTDKNLFEIAMQNYGVEKDLIDKWYQEIKNKDIKEQIKIYNYRPFDNRFTIYNTKILQRARKDIMDNFFNDNLAITTPKNSKQDNFNEVFIVDSFTDKHLIGHQTFVFPLFLYGNSGDQQKLFGNITFRHVNFANKLWTYISPNIEPEKVFNYIYAVLYSNVYRKKYNEFLRIDFPRIPFTKDEKLFYKIAEIGKELVDLHLLKSKSLENISTNFPVIGDNRIEKREYNDKEEKIYINEKQYFDGVKSEIWNYYIGGYQVLDKWLKDRQGKILSPEDTGHFLKMITALNLTIHYQKEIDKLYLEVEKTL